MLAALKSLPDLMGRRRLAPSAWTPGGSPTRPRTLPPRNNTALCWRRWLGPDCRYLSDLTEVGREGDLQAALGRALEKPGEYDDNWDALRDLLRERGVNTPWAIAMVFSSAPVSCAPTSTDSCVRSRSCRTCRSSGRTLTSPTASWSSSTWGTGPRLGEAGVFAAVSRVGFGLGHATGNGRACSLHVLGLRVLSPPAQRTERGPGGSAPVLPRCQPVRDRPTATFARGVGWRGAVWAGGVCAVVVRGVGCWWVHGG